MKKSLPILALTAVASIPTVNATTLIVGSDFSDAATFNTTGGVYSQTTDDLVSGDGVTIGFWSGDFVAHDTNSDSMATSGRAAKLNGVNDHRLLFSG